VAALEIKQDEGDALPDEDDTIDASPHDPGDSAKGCPLPTSPPSRNSCGSSSSNERAVYDVSILKWGDKCYWS
jgi:hypothetical protein